MRRILAGGIVRQHPQVLAAHLETMRAQALPEGVSMDLCYLDDNELPESTLVLRRAARTLPAERGGGSGAYAIGEYTHEWHVADFHRLAREKQRLLDLALAEGYDAVWLVDSDLLVEPGTLSSLLGSEAPIVSAVFWTRWTPEDMALPQVWTTHPYGFEGAGWTTERFLAALHEKQRVRVRGLGACTLIDRAALERGVGFWPLLGDLPAEGMWQGEDRHFSVRAERLHVPLYADAWPEVWHCYRPSQREQLEAQLARLAAPAKERPEWYDWVSFTVEPLEEPALAGHVEHVRGRLGLRKLAPEVEHALSEMRVGEARFLRARVEGVPKMLRVRLLAAKDGRSA